MERFAFRRQTNRCRRILSGDRIRHKESRQGEIPLPFVVFSIFVSFPAAAAQEADSTPASPACRTAGCRYVWPRRRCKAGADFSKRPADSRQNSFFSLRMVCSSCRSQGLHSARMALSRRCPIWAGSRRRISATPSANTVSSARCSGSRSSAGTCSAVQASLSPGEMPGPDFAVIAVVTGGKTGAARIAVIKGQGGIHHPETPSGRTFLQCSDIIQYEL